MSDPTTLEVGPDETERIITESDAESGLAYIVEVSNAPIRFAHQKRNADRGAELSAGMTHTLTNLRGKPIYITGVGGTASVRVRPAGADVNSQPPKGVTVEGDVVISSSIGLENTSGSQIDPATEQKQDDMISILQQIETNTSN